MLDFVDSILSRGSIFSQMFSTFLNRVKCGDYTMQQIKPPSNERDMFP